MVHSRRGATLRRISWHYVSGMVTIWTITREGARAIGKTCVRSWRSRRAHWPTRLPLSSKHSTLLSASACERRIRRPLRHVLGPPPWNPPSEPRPSTTRSSDDGGKHTGHLTSRLLRRSRATLRALQLTLKP